jgi:hypothetical protein
MLCLLLTFSSTIFLLPPIKAEEGNYPPGVCGTPPLIEPVSYTLKGLSTCWFYFCTYSGVWLDTAYDYDFELDGPLLGRYYWDPPYVSENNLQLEEITKYVPIILLTREDWYSHEFSLTKTDTSSLTFDVSMNIGIGDGACSIYGGATQTQISTTVNQFEYTLETGSWKIIYVKMVFLHVFGSLKFCNGEVRTYDAMLLQNVDWLCRYVTSEENGDQKELPEINPVYYDSPNDGDTDPEKIYSMGTQNIEYSDYKSVSQYIGIKLEGEYKDYISLGGEAKFTYSSSSEVNVAHKFYGPDQINPPIYWRWDNFFSVNTYLDNTPPSISIESPSSYYVSGTVNIDATATDDVGVKNIQAKIGSGSWHDTPFNWDSTAYPDYTRFTITYKAWDSYGNYATKTKNIKVLNGGGGGGGGCPRLFIFNGKEFIEEGLLDIHNLEGNDMITIRDVINEPARIFSSYIIKLTEHHKTISHIDQTKFYGEDENGEWMKLDLINAIHSELGNVRRALLFSDDQKVDLVGGDHNNGLSETIYLRFKVPERIDFKNFEFYIEGNNMIVK